MKRLLLALLILGASLPALAQTPVITQPYGANNHNDSSTITATNTFQSIWAASTQSTGRTDCVIQNNGAANMFIFFGPIANATTPSSLTLVPAGIFKCANSGVVIKDQISITGTISQEFFAIQY